MIPYGYDEVRAIERTGVEFGSYNSMPEPAMSISAEEFASALIQHRIVGVEVRQPQMLSFATVRLFWSYDSNAVGVSMHYTPGEGWRYQYWRFGCDHDMQEVGVDGMVRAYRCVKCRYERTVDSSG